MSRKTAKQVRARPGLKLQTMLEERKTDLRLLSNRQRWEYLFSLNAWKPTRCANYLRGLMTSSIC